MKAIFLTVLCILLVSCMQDDEPVIADAALEGEWVLTNVACFCFFEPDTDFTSTRLIFEPEDSKITVIHDGDLSFFREAGVYYYGGQGNRIGFSDNSVYRFEINGSLLTLTYQDEPEIADDEVFYTLRRN